MRHVQTQKDWYYELRPAMIAALGVFGILSNNIVGLNHVGLALLSQVSGAVLLFSSYKIFQWRYAYRKNI